MSAVAFSEVLLGFLLGAHEVIDLLGQLDHLVLELYSGLLLNVLFFDCLLAHGFDPIFKLLLERLQV